MNIEIDDIELDLMLTSYMRYSLECKTYIVSSCCDTLVKYVPKLRLEQQERIISELAIDLARAKIKKEKLGTEIDHICWVNCLKNLRQQHTNMVNINE